MLLCERLEAFEGDKYSWPIYQEQVHLFFRANNTHQKKQWEFPGKSASSYIPSAARAEKLGTLHKYAERESKTVDHSSSLDQAQVPHQPAVRVGIAGGRWEVQQQTQVPPQSGSTSGLTTHLLLTCGTQAFPIVCATVYTNRRSFRAPHFHITGDGGQCVGHFWQTFQKDLPHTGRRSFRCHAAELPDRTFSGPRPGPGIGFAHWVFGCQEVRKQPYMAYKTSRAS
ncbi:hypothetical protein MRX96_028870 [Rhipicephalus microplus]